MTKNELKRHKDLKRERDHLIKLIGELEAVMYGPKATNYSGMPHGAGFDNNGGPTAELAMRHIELQNKYTEKVQQLNDSLLAIESAIEVLPPRERMLIRLYYIQGLTWEQVCIAMSYEWAQVHRIHALALQMLARESETKIIQ